jgi:hypothetical protein
LPRPGPETALAKFSKVGLAQVGEIVSSEVAGGFSQVAQIAAVSIEQGRIHQDRCIAKTRRQEVGVGADS